MTAVTRWIQYNVSSAGVAGTGGGTAAGTGTRGYSIATGGVDVNSFNIGAANNRLHVSIDGDSAYITIVSGTGLDPRLVARDISEKLHNLGKADPRYDQAQCVWENNQLKLYSGSLGSSSSVAVVSGTNTAHLELGWGTKTEVGGSNNNIYRNPPALNQYNGGLTVSGTYNGLFDEIYTIVIHNGWTIGTPTKDGSNSYTGTITTGGIFNHYADITYTINISAVNGTTMGAGAGNVPQMSWTSTGNVDNSAAAVDLLYPNYFYKVGTKGLMVKFSDAVFNTVSPAYTIACTYPQTTHGSNSQGVAGDAQYVWGSSRGDDSGNNPLATSEVTTTRLGSRGLYIKFTGDNMFLAGDTFQVICTGPQPQSYDITGISYGNVTVSTESPVKSVLFEILSGAIEMNTVKFGLQSHGTFTHHDANNADTYFRFGTVGPGQNAGSAPINGLEWRAGVTAADISNDIPPSYLYATKEDLAVVSDADTSEVIGSSGFMGMVSDPIWMGIRLGASEVGSNSLVNYRVYFDYS